MQFQIQKDINQIKNSALQHFYPWTEPKSNYHLSTVALIDEQFYWLENLDKSNKSVLVLRTSLNEFILHTIELYSWGERLVPQDLFSIRDFIMEFDLEWDALYEYFGESLRELKLKWGFILDLPLKYQKLILNGIAEPGLLKYMCSNGFKWRDCYADILSDFQLSYSQQRNVIELLGRYIRREGFDSATFIKKYQDVLNSFDGDRRKLISFLNELCSPRLVEYRMKRESKIKDLQHRLNADQIEWDRSLESCNIRLHWSIKTFEDFKALKKILKSSEIDVAIAEILEN